MQDHDISAIKMGKAAIAGMAMMVALIVFGPALPAAHITPPLGMGWQQVALA